MKAHLNKIEVRKIFCNAHVEYATQIGNKLVCVAKFFFIYFAWYNNMRGNEMDQRWNQLGFSRPDQTDKFQNHRRSTGF